MLWRLIVTEVASHDDHDMMNKHVKVFISQHFHTNCYINTGYLGYLNYHGNKASKSDSILIQKQNVSGQKWLIISPVSKSDFFPAPGIVTWSNIFSHCAEAPPVIYLVPAVFFPPFPWGENVQGCRRPTTQYAFSVWYGSSRVLYPSRIVTLPGLFWQLKPRSCTVLLETLYARLLTTHLDFCGMKIEHLDPNLLYGWSSGKGKTVQEG